MGTVRKRIADLDLSLLKEAGRNSGDESFFADMIVQMREKTLIPVISNALFYYCIFSQDENPTDQVQVPVTGEEIRGPYTTEEDLCGKWANYIHYPLHDKFDLARVAQYKSTVDGSSLKAKRSYLNFLKYMLLSTAKKDGAGQKFVNEQTDRINECTFTDLCQDLGYPKPSGSCENPIRILARLSLPLYITTSSHDFLERALVLEHKEPRTQICFWSGENGLVDPSHETIHHPKLDPKHPIVYHLLGLENYPASLVISEDDYLDFLTKILQDTEKTRPLIPLYLPAQISSSELVLLGYRLLDWDFRVLFRSLILPRKEKQIRNLIIQLDPDRQQPVLNLDCAREYLEKYFDKEKFDVAWYDSAKFLQNFWEEWEKANQS
jgi:hypothetical protein